MKDFCSKTSREKESNPRTTVNMRMTESGNYQSISEKGEKGLLRTYNIQKGGYRETYYIGLI